MNECITNTPTYPYREREWEREWERQLLFGSCQRLLTIGPCAISFSLVSSGFAVFHFITFAHLSHFLYWLSISLKFTIRRRQCANCDPDTDRDPDPDFNTFFFYFCNHLLIACSTAECVLLFSRQAAVQPLGPFNHLLLASGFLPAQSHLKLIAPRMNYKLSCCGSGCCCILFIDCHKLNPTISFDKRQLAFELDFPVMLASSLKHIPFIIQHCSRATNAAVQHCCPLSMQLFSDFMRSDFSQLLFHWKLFQQLHFTHNLIYHYWTDFIYGLKQHWNVVKKLN